MQDELEDAFWARHSNPKSGWSRVLVMPTLLYAIYRRNWRLAVLAVVFTVLNPLLFSPPETDDAWMTRVVLAERWWTKENERGLLDLSYPNSLNVCNIPITGYALVAAYRKRPVRAGVAGVSAMALKFWYVGVLVDRYDAETADAE